MSIERTMAEAAHQSNTNPYATAMQKVRDALPDRGRGVGQKAKAYYGLYNCDLSAAERDVLQGIIRGEIK